MKKCLLLGYLLLAQVVLHAGEGMWLPLLLNQLNATEMRDLGMRMTPEDIYSVNEGSLKDAIVHFGGFCTGEIISNTGLILTNHHCGYSEIQSHSTLDNNYLEDGFWAENHAAELPNPGLFVTFIVRMEDVTEQALANVSDAMNESDRSARIEGNLARLRSATSLDAFQDVVIKPFFAGNQYFLFITETYNDVRLVGAPPSSIGKFGADTDNWVWPRHTGDFSLFRVYAGPDNQPADYSPDNKPLTPRHFLPISLDGVAEGDFTLVFGFPGRTDEYLPASAVAQRVNTLNPARISVRDRSLSVIGEAMRNDPQVKIQYASKQASIANSWKKWIGENQGIAQTGGLIKKMELQAEFRQRIAADAALKKQYSGVLDELDALYEKRQPYALADAYLEEITYRNVEILRMARILRRYVEAYQKQGLAGIEERLPGLTRYMEGFYKDYQPDVDRKVFTAVMPFYFEMLNGRFQNEFAFEKFDEAGNDYEQFTQMVFQKSMLTSGEKILMMMERDPGRVFDIIGRDVLYQLTDQMLATGDATAALPLKEIDDQIEPLQRRYMAGLMAAFPERTFYPDANSTMRVTYGQVRGYEPRDAVNYDPNTYLEGVIQKYVPGDYEFDVPEQLLALYEAKDYGPYGEDGQMPVCFIGTNHTTGGNSGSPAIDAHGNLVGLNFDRVWEGTMSDIYYDPSICRNIMVDARYILFLIDKFAGATHLVEEMELVHPKG